MSSSSDSFWMVTVGSWQEVVCGMLLLKKSDAFRDSSGFVAAGTIYWQGY